MAFSLQNHICYVSGVSRLRIPFSVQTRFIESTGVGKLTQFPQFSELKRVSQNNDENIKICPPNNTRAAR